MAYLNLQRLFVNFMSIERYGNQRKASCLTAISKKKNSFDLFATKVCDQETNKIVDHLPREISRITKFLLNRSAVVTTKLTYLRNRRSPLVHGWLEIQSKVTVKVDSKLKNFTSSRKMKKSFLLEEKSASKSTTNVARNGGSINKTNTHNQKGHVVKILEIFHAFKKCEKYI